MRLYLHENRKDRGFLNITSHLISSHLVPNLSNLRDIRTIFLFIAQSRIHGCCIIGARARTGIRYQGEEIRRETRRLTLAGAIVIIMGRKECGLVHKLGPETDETAARNMPDQYPRSTF